MEDTIVNTVLNSIKPDSLCVSLRLLRLMLSVLLVFAVLTEPTLSDFWQILLSVLAVYTLVTGTFGRDPVFSLLRRSNRKLPENALDVVAQLECLSIGLICFVGGMSHQYTHSLLFLLLPFFGIYPIVLCIVKHDLLGFLLQSYRR
jgi:hypothetical protein